MRISVVPALFLGVAILAGCGSTLPIVTGSPIVAAQNLTGNWQIESTSGGGTSTPGILLLGDLVSSGATVSGTFRFSNLASGNTCGALNQVITVTGTVDTTNPSAEVLRLTSAAFTGSVLTVQITLPTLLQGFGSGTLQVTGTTCSYAAAAAIASQFPSVTGTYMGTLAPLANFPGNVTTSGNATLTLTQATVPSVDGQFATTGSLVFTSGSCSITTAISGNTSGSEVQLTSMPTLIPFSLNTIIAFVPPNGLAPNLMAQLVMNPAACTAALSSGAAYSGTLTKQ